MLEPPPKILIPLPDVNPVADIEETDPVVRELATRDSKVPLVVIVPVLVIRMALPVVKPLAVKVISPVGVVAALAVKASSLPVVVIIPASEIEARVPVNSESLTTWNIPLLAV